MGHTAFWVACGLSVLMLAGAVGLGLSTSGDPRSTEAMSATLATLEQPLFLWRLLCFGGLLLGWHPLIDKLGQWRAWPPEQRQILHETRGSVIVWLLVLELLLGQNIVGQALRLVQ